MDPYHLHDPARIRRKRVEAGLNIKTVAERAGFDETHLSRIERGLRGVSAETLAKIAQVLGCEVADLLLPEDDTNGDPAPAVAS